MEPSLVFLFPEGASRAVSLPAAAGQEEISVGRAADSTVEIDHPAVSRHHLRLVRVMAGASEEAGNDPAGRVVSGWRAEDTHSTNGTLHNGDPLGPAPVDLRDGDCLAFGPDPAAVRAVYLDDPGPDAGVPNEFPPAGATLTNRYVLEKILGQTFESQNYRALDAGNDRIPTLLRVFRRDAFPAADAFPALVARVDRLRAIPSHPGLVRCLDVRREAGRVFVVSRWVPGGFPTLDLLRTRRALTPAEAMRLLGVAASASDHVAEHGRAPLDLSLQATLLAFHPPLADGVEGWESLRHGPLESWPAFTPRFAVSLLAPLAETGERLRALARFACELLGRPLPGGSSTRLPRIVHRGLGESGNNLLCSVLTSTNPEADPPGKPIFATGLAFVGALAQAAGLDPAQAGAAAGHGG